VKILVTGANGMLGNDVCPLLIRKGYKVFMTDLKNVQKELQLRLNVCDFPKVESMINDIMPDMVIHLAAETDVDKCEVEERHAYNINTFATENIARVCKKNDIILVYASTAAVFDGEKKVAYIETDKPKPQSVYAKSKFKGEEAVRKLVKKHFITRAGWMIGGIDKDKKFVAKILKILETQNELSVVNDKFGSPTSTKDVAYCLGELITTASFNTYHMANKGSCSRYDMAKKIVEYLGRDDVTINPVSSNLFPFPAVRGRSEVLENNRLNKLGMNYMRPWQDALKDYVLEWKKRRKI